MLDESQVRSFIRDGYVRIEGAFSRETAEAARRILWRDSRCDPADRATWTRPVIRLGHYHQPPFIDAVDNPTLCAAFDRLVGAGRWHPCRAVGTFPIRFPSEEDPGDTGWHVDMGFGMDSPDFLDWRINLASRGRALLMLLLFSDVGEEDAPTRIRIGSHLGIARRLAAAGDDGLTLRQLTADGFEELAGRGETLATGEAGTAYLCHPFIVHSAQSHRGTRPRFLAQPPLLPAATLSPSGPSPVEAAIRLALQRGD